MYIHHSLKTAGKAGIALMLSGLGSQQASAQEVCISNGQCGGGEYTQWLHCNGVIGFGNISDNYN